ncbi:MAG: murein biosynthesis integral membrane protein MurJ [Actinomycetota bacterium]
MSRSTDRLKRGRIGIAALIVSGGILISRILGVVREMIFAALLGADHVTDQYVAAFRIPDYANYLLAGGFLTITFIPIFSKYLADDDEGEGWRGFTSIVRWLVIAISGLIVIAWFAAPWVIETIYPDFTAEQISTTIRLTRIVMTAQFAFVVGAMFASVQYAKGVFTIPTLAPIIYNVGIIAGGVIYAGVTGTADPEGFIWGAVAGAFVGNLAVQYWGARRVGMRLDFAAGWRHPAVLQYVALAIPLMIGQSIVALDETFMSVFGDLVGDGAQTHLQYARRTMLVPVGIIAQGAAVAAYPFLARLWAEGNIRAMHRTVDKAMRWVLVLSIAAAGLLAALSLPVIRALFERFAFGEADSGATAAALFFYALSIPIWGALQILSRAFYARKSMWTPVIVGTGATVVAVPLYIGLGNSFGIRGVALASVLSLGLYTAVLALLWYSGAEGRARLRKVLSIAGRAIPPTVLGSAAAFLIGWAVMTNLPFQTTIVSVIAVLLGAAAFFGIAFSLGSFLYDILTAAARRRPPADPDETDVMEIIG